MNAPATRPPATRTDYMAGRVTHQQYYSGLADVIGRAALTRIVLRHVAPLERLRASNDPHLNDLPLDRWDRCDALVRPLISHNAGAVMAVSWEGQPLKPKTYCWSLNETVCVLKAVARDLITGYPGGPEIDVYAEMLATGLPLDSHESDLYVEVTPATRAIVERYQHRNNVTSFTHAVNGRQYFDIPFAFTPFWNAKGRW